MKQLGRVSPKRNDILVHILVILCYLMTDISDIDQTSLFHLTHISLSPTLISFMPINLYFIWLVSMNK